MRYHDAMPEPCKTCGHPELQAIEAALFSGQSARSLSRLHGLSYDSLTRHIRQRHAQNAREASQRLALATIAPQDVPALTPAVSATLRDVQRLAVEAKRHLKRSRSTDDLKATNGAISSATKALELVGKLRGELQNAAKTDISISLDARTAVDLRSTASQLDSRAVTDQAQAWLCAQAEAGDAHAIEAIGALVRGLRSAETTSGVIASDQELGPATG